MTFLQFNTLEEDLQLRHLLVDGVCIATRNTDEAQVLLFQLHGFYMEVFFGHDDDCIVGSRNFDDLDELQPYLQNLVLPKVF